MQCPSCGLQIDQQNLKWCPRCGEVLATASAPAAKEPSGRRFSQRLYMYVRKLNRRLIVSIIVAIGVVLVACTGATLWGMRLTAQTTVLDPALATATARANPPSPSVSIGGVIYQNTFTSDDKGWRNNEDDCHLGNDGYHVNGNYACYAPIGSLTDVDITVDVEQISGPSTNLYGIVFRAGGNGTNYQFLIDSSGEWMLAVCKNYNCVNLVALTHNDAIHGSLTQRTHWRRM